MTDEGKTEFRKEGGAKEEETNLATYLGIAAVVVIVAVVGYIFLIAGGSGGEDADWTGVKAGDGEDPSLVSANSTSGDHTLTVYYYGDFECPHCKDFEDRFMPKLIKQYVKPGKIKLVYRALNFFKKPSERAGQASIWVWKNDKPKYWSFHRKLISEQKASTWTKPSQLKGYAEEVGVSDPTSVAESVRNNTYLTDIQDNVAKAHDQEVHATPTIVVNGTKITANNFPRVKKVINQNLNTSG
ncbi:MAG: DsbA family protein [Halobacteria archaeon]